MLGGCNTRGFQFFEQLRFKTLQLFVPNSKRLGGYTQWVHFFLRKSARQQEDFFKTDHFKASQQKEPGPSYIRVLLDKEPRYMLGSPSTKNQSNFKTRPSSSLFQKARGLGATPRWEYFFLKKKVHTTRRSHEALHGFAQESTRTMLVPTRQDLKEQDEASRAQPWSARGLVDTEPMGYPTWKREDLV